MSNPALARTSEDGSRFYPWAGERYWSVSTIIAGGVPKFLVPWATKAVADLTVSDLQAAAVHSRARAQIRRWAALGRADVLARQAAGELTSIKLAKLTDVDLALRWLKGAADRIRDAAASKGRDFHDEAELEVLRAANATGEFVTGADTTTSAEWDARTAWPEHLAGHRASFLRFLEWAKPRYLMTEATVFNRAQAYAGTLDAVMTFKRTWLFESLVDRAAPIPRWLVAWPDDTVPLVVDYKSGNDVYPEVGLQLAAYSRGEFVGLADGETTAPLPPVAGGAVLHVTGKRFRFRLVDIGDEVYRSFLHAREVFRFRNDIAPRVFLADLTPEEEHAA